MSKRLPVAVFLTVLMVASAYAKTTDFFELVETGTPQEVQAAINKGASVNARDNGGMTPLMWAARDNQNPEMIITLLKAGADVNAKDSHYGQTALTFAAQNTNLEVTTMLLKAGANVNARDNDGMTPLMYAAGYGNSEQIITMFLKAGADINAHDETFGRTALMYALNRSKTTPRTIITLLTAGADFEARDNHGMTPLMYAAQNTNPEVNTLLLKADANVNARDNGGGTVLMWAGSPEVIILLLKAGANLNARDNDGETALMVDAESTQNPDVITTLLNAGADLNARTTSIGETALMLAAARSGKLDVVTTLLKAGADVNARDTNGMTPLMHAASPVEDTPGVITTLLKAGADVTARDKIGETALELARQRGADALKEFEKAFEEASVTHSSAAQPQAARGELMHQGEVLNPGQAIASTDGRFRFIYQQDGNLVLYRGNKALWASGTYGRGTGICIMQTDGNLVVYSPPGHPIWASNTAGYPGSYLVVQNDGDVVLYRPDHRALWATNALPPAVVPASSVEMVSVQGGAFMMGSPNSEPGRYPNEVQHQVTVSSFHMAKYDVTQDLYQSVMGSDPSRYMGDMNRPVESVSWYDAVEFCNKLSARDGLQKVYTISETDVTADWSANGYRLPTEAEWEYAARGGQQGASAYHVYAGSDNIDQVGWYAGNSGSTTHPVGQKAPNALGLYDMSGNVWQWCWGSYHVLRGGSWDLDAQYDRVAIRPDLPNYRADTLGFRLVRP